MAIAGKVVVITGASSGFGELTAKVLTESGAKVVLGARRIENLEKITDEIKSKGGEATYKATDVTKLSDVQELVKLAVDTYGKVDVIFNNAGIMPNSPLSALRVDEWDAMVDINLKGVMNGIAAVLPYFTEQKSGHVITTSSVAGLNAYPGCGPYCATKFAVKALMEVLRIESANEGTNIRTTTLYPAAFNTELTHKIGDETTSKGMNALYEAVGQDPIAIANIVKFAIDQPEEISVNEFTIYPTKQA